MNHDEQWGALIALVILVGYAVLYWRATERLK